jgi:hypothetical protein
VHAYIHLTLCCLVHVRRLLRVQLPHELLEPALPPVLADPTTQLAQLHQPPGSSPAQQRLQNHLVRLRSRHTVASVKKEVDNSPAISSLCVVRRSGSTLGSCAWRHALPPEIHSTVDNQQGFMNEQSHSSTIQHSEEHNL